MCGVRAKNTRKVLLTEKNLKFDKALDIATGLESAERGNEDL